MAVIIRFILTLFRWGWKILTFIKDLILNTLAIFVILFGIVIFAAVQQSRPVQPQDGVLMFNLAGVIVEEPRDDSVFRELANEALGLNDPTQRENSLFDIVESIRQAKDDKNITGIVLSLGQFVGGSQTSLEYIGKALQEFKTSGKPVIAVGRNFSQSQYYLASFADEIYLAPQGGVDVTGIATNGLYYKTLLDKLKITTHVFRVGTYKSAVEPFIRDDMSPEARENAQRWLNALWNNYLSRVAENRKSEAHNLAPDIDTFITRLKGVSGDTTAYALKYGFVDKVMPYFDVEQLLKEKFGTRNKTDALKSVSIYDYTLATPAPKANQIGVIFVNGTISGGESTDGVAGANSIIKQLRKARTDKKIGAVVLRVNSPGGGVGASEAIRSEVEALVKTGKPVVVSMAGVAASGGYWISTPANYIIASPSTLTGSIGIFGLINTFENSLDYIGVHADGVSTSPLAAATTVNELDPRVSQIFQLTIENGYRQFLALVAKSRNKTPEQIDKVAQGQVWLGTDAYKLGLVDKLGDFDDALAKAASLAKLSSDGYEINWFSAKPTLQDLFRSQDSVALKALLPKMMMGYLPEPLSKAATEFNAQQEMFKTINDPKNQYIYCLDCGYQN
jgi:protease-4